MLFRSSCSFFLNRRSSVVRFIPAVMRVSGTSGTSGRIRPMASASRMVRGIGDGSVLLSPAPPPPSVLCTASATPTFTSPATPLACPSDSATSHRSVVVTPFGPNQYLLQREGLFPATKPKHPVRCSQPDASYMVSDCTVAHFMAGTTSS